MTWYIQQLLVLLLKFQLLMFTSKQQKQVFAFDIFYVTIIYFPVFWVSLGILLSNKINAYAVMNKYMYLILIV